MTPSQLSSPFGDGLPVAAVSRADKPLRPVVSLPLRAQLRLDAVCATAFLLIPVELSRLSASTSTNGGDHTTRLPLSALKALTLPPVACPPTACQRGYEPW